MDVLGRRGSGGMGWWGGRGKGGGELERGSVGKSWRGKLNDEVRRGKGGVELGKGKGENRVTGKYGPGKFVNAG